MVHANDSNEWKPRGGGGLLLNSKYIKMAREERGFRALLTQLPIVIVCHELIIWRLTIYALRWSEMSVQYHHVKPSR